LDLEQENPTAFEKYVEVVEEYNDVSRSYFELEYCFATLSALESTDFD
jgi:hypothetical protein